MAKKKTLKPSTVCPPAHGFCDGTWVCKIGIVVIALLFLATDMGWITWWKLNWWTVAFILIAVHKIFMYKCK